MKSVTYAISLLILSSCKAQQMRNLEGLEHPNESTYEQPTMPSQPSGENQVLQGLSQNAVVDPNAVIEVPTRDVSQPIEQSVQENVNNAGLSTPNVNVSVPDVNVSVPEVNVNTPNSSQSAPNGGISRPNVEPVKTETREEIRPVRTESQVEQERPARRESKVEQEVQKAEQAPQQKDEQEPEQKFATSTQSQQEPMVESIEQVDSEIAEVNPQLSQQIHEVGQESKSEANQIEASLEQQAVHTVEQQNNATNMTAQEEEVAVSEQIRRTISNHGIRDEDLDNILDSTFNVIPGMDEEQKAEYKSQAKEQYNSMSKDDFMKMLGGFAAATGLTCFGCCAMCKDKDEEKQYNEQNDEIEVQQTYED